MGNTSESTLREAGSNWCSGSQKEKTNFFEVLVLMYHIGIWQLYTLPNTHRKCSFKENVVSFGRGY